MPPESTPTEPTVATSKVWGVLKDVATLLVVPAFIWIIKLEVGNAQRDLKIEELNSDLSDLRADFKEAQTINKTVQEQALKLAVLEGKLDTANGRLVEIQTLLRPHP